MVTEAVGAAGTAGTALTVSGVAADTQVLSVALRAVTLCAPGATPVNVVEAPGRFRHRGYTRIQRPLVQ